MSTEPESVVIIPARWGSTRFPGKPLVVLEGKPLIQWVYEAASRARKVRQVLVATDDSRIQQAVAGFGGTAVMTGDHPSGSDRIAEVARTLECEVVVNLQGDEPLTQPEQIDQLIEALHRHPEIPVATLKFPLTAESQVHDPNLVKVVTDSQGRALYFSRSPIPYARDGGGVGEAGGAAAAGPIRWYGHLGLYAYRKPFLMEYTRMPPTGLEQAEKLEQLRILENGYPILVLETEVHSPGVDCPEDLEKVKRQLRQTASQ